MDDNKEPRPDLSSQSQDYEDQDPSVDSDVGKPTATSDETRNLSRELKREWARQMYNSSSSSSEEQKSVESIGEWSSDLKLSDGELTLNSGKTNKEQRVAPRSAATPNPAGGENSVD